MSCEIKRFMISRRCVTRDVAIQFYIKFLFDSIKMLVFLFVLQTAILIHRISFRLSISFQKINTLSFLLLLIFSIWLITNSCIIIPHIRAFSIWRILCSRFGVSPCFTFTTLLRFQQQRKFNS